MQELDEVNRNTTPRWSTPKGEQLTDSTLITTGFNLNFPFIQNKGFIIIKNSKTIENKQMDRLSEEDSELQKKDKNQSAWLKEEKVGWL